MRRGWMTAGLGIAALLTSIWWLQRPDPMAAEADSGFRFVLPVTLTHVERDTLQPVAELTGNVRAARRAVLSFETEGLVESLKVDEADRVEKGAVLATLSAGDERHGLAAAQAALRLAERELELLQAGEREEEKQRLKAVLEAAQAESDLAIHEVERGQKLLDERILSESEQDVLRMQHRAADKRRVAAEQTYARAVAGTRAENLAIARARVDERQVRVATAQHNLEKTELKAPWSGAIVLRQISVGAYVSSGEGVFELVDLENLEVHLEIPGRFAPRLSRGGRVRLSIPGDEDNAFETELDATIQAADELARSFRAIARLSAKEANQAGLRPGLFCHARLFFEPLVDVLCVPSDAIMASERGMHLVRARSESGAGGHPSLTAEFVAVRIVAEAQDRCAIEALAAPLYEGDAICLVGADNAFPGAPLLSRGANPQGPSGEEDASHGGRASE